MAALKCIFCGKITVEKEINIQKKHQGRIIAIKNAIVNECIKCNEIFYSNETTSVVKFAFEQLSHKNQIILYEKALHEYEKVNEKSNIIDEFKNIARKNSNGKKIETSILDDLFEGPYYRRCIQAIEEQRSSNDIRKDLIVLIYHYSFIKPVKAIITNNNEENCSLRFSKELVTLGFKKGDPMVLRFSDNGQGYNVGCVVEKKNDHNNTLLFSVVALHYYREQRRSDRIPVSIYAEVSILNANIKYSIVVKDLSTHGLLFCTKDKFNTNTPVEIYLHTPYKIICLIGAIVREQICEHNNEYGVEIVKIDKDDMYFLKQHIMCL